jgi:protein NrfC
MNYKDIDLSKMKNEGLDAITNVERRTFLKMGLAITGVFAGGQILSVASTAGEAYASSGAAMEDYPYDPHYSMLVQPNLCVDCERCLAACKKTNNVPDYGYRTAILQKQDAVKASGRKREFIPVLCNQCNRPPCVRVCPTKATYKDKQNGIVRMQDEKCIGCKFCVAACPYNARYFNSEKRAIDKCNFCFDTRLEKGEELTACSEACPTGARMFGNVSNPRNKVYRMVHQLEKPVWVLRPEAGAKPNVFYM